MNREILKPVRDMNVRYGKMKEEDQKKRVAHTITTLWLRCLFMR